MIIPRIKLYSLSNFGRKIYRQKLFVNVSTAMGWLSRNRENLETAANAAYEGAVTSKDVLKSKLAKFMKDKGLTMKDFNKLDEQGKAAYKKIIDTHRTQNPTTVTEYTQQRGVSSSQRRQFNRDMQAARESGTGATAPNYTLGNRTIQSYDLKSGGVVGKKAKFKNQQAAATNNNVVSTSQPTAFQQTAKEVAGTNMDVRVNELLDTAPKMKGETDAAFLQRVTQQASTERQQGVGRNVKEGWKERNKKHNEQVQVQREQHQQQQSQQQPQNQNQGQQNQNQGQQNQNQGQQNQNQGQQNQNQGQQNQNQGQQNNDSFLSGMSTTDKAIAGVAGVGTLGVGYSMMNGKDDNNQQPQQ